MDPLTALSLFGAVAPLLGKLRESLAAGEGDHTAVLDLLDSLGKAPKVDPILVALSTLAEKMPADPNASAAFRNGVTRVLDGIAALREAGV